MKTLTYTALAENKKGDFITLFTDAGNEQEAELNFASKAKKQGLKLHLDTIDCDLDDENNFGITI